MAAYSHPDDVFKALADPSRRRLLDSLNARNGQTLGELCSGLDMARQSVSKHLAVLEAATLVTTMRRGREKLHYLNAAPINEIGQRWITQYERDRVHARTRSRAADRHGIRVARHDRPLRVHGGGLERLRPCRRCWAISIGARRGDPQSDGARARVRVRYRRPAT